MANRKRSAFDTLYHGSLLSTGFTDEQLAPLNRRQLARCAEEAERMASTIEGNVAVFREDVRRVGLMPVGHERTMAERHRVPNWRSTLEYLEGELPTVKDDARRLRAALALKDGGKRRRGP